jgi:nucleotide-binding universal stress UspA family protein
VDCIVCATRGGQGSRAVQLRAIELAKERESKLVFLYVVDIHIVGEYDEALSSAVRAEFHWLGRALLRVAQQRAERAEVDAEIAIRDGEVKEEIERFLQESHATLLLLGASRDTSTHVFGDDAIEHFAQTIEEDTGVKVEVVRAEVV